MRYHGGKWRLAPWILGFFPEHRVYVEPYGGAASILMRKERCQSEIYNDLDQGVVNVFQVMREPESAKRLHELLELTPFAREEFNLTYEPATEPIEQARRTIIRSFMGFGSASFNSAHATGFRVYVGTNRQRRPHQDWVSYPRQIEAFVARLQGVIIESRPALDIILRHHSDETLLYVDPPYPLSTRGSVNGVRQKYQIEMFDVDHVALADVLRSVKGMVVISGYPCELYEKLYPGWERHEKKAMADGANPRTEVIWLNPTCSAALREKARKTA
jgi:DNA adenine methylase